MIPDPYYIHYDGKTQLHFSCLASNIELAKELVNQGVDINKHDIDGSTALFIAKDSVIVKMLIRAGADPNLQQFRSGYNPLLDSMVWWNADKFNLLVPVTDLNSKTSFGYTALMFAAKYHSLDYINLLIDTGADIYVRNFEGEDFYDFLFDTEKEYILFRFPDFLYKRELYLTPALIKARSKILL